MMIQAQLSMGFKPAQIARELNGSPKTFSISGSIMLRFLHLGFETALL